MSQDRYFADLAGAFVRGRLGAGGVPPDAPAEEAIRRGLQMGLRLHGFKRSAELPRVRKALGILRGLGPESLLDVGSGRGAFLWPLLNAFPSLAVVAVDRRPAHVADIRAVHAGGVSRLAALLADATRLPLRGRSVDVVTILEVLEHLEQPERAAAEAVRVARRFVVASVPSRPDDNPEHLRLFSAGSVERIFLEAGATRVAVEFVPNHMIAVAGVRRP